jgi:hypothetical protein
LNVVIAMPPSFGDLSLRSAALRGIRAEADALCGFAAPGVWRGADASEAVLAHHVRMRATYAVVWQEGQEPVASGRLEVRPRSVAFTGADHGCAVERVIPIESLRAIRVGRAPADRLAGRCSLVLEPRVGPTIRVASVAQPGIISELAQRIAELHPGGEDRPRRLLVSVPLKEGALERARELIADGPPFDPDETALERHRVFLLEDEALFVFETGPSSRKLEDALARPDLWQGAGAWQELVAGVPRIAEDAYSWDRQPSLDVEATGTPGES